MERLLTYTSYLLRISNLLGNEVSMKKVLERKPSLIIFSGLYTYRTEI